MDHERKEGRVARVRAVRYDAHQGELCYALAMTCYMHETHRVAPMG